MMLGMSDIPSTDPSAPPEVALAPEVVEKPPSPFRQRLEVRLWCAFVLLMAGAILGIGLWLTPDPRGTGSHQQLGLPSCTFLDRTGIPCPTCGCTTAVSNFSHGHVLRSLLTQPFGFAVALLSLTLIPLTGWGVATGKWKGPSMFWLAWHWQWWVYGGLAILALGWFYKTIIIKQQITF